MQQTLGPEATTTTVLLNFKRTLLKKKKKKKTVVVKKKAATRKRPRKRQNLAIVSIVLEVLSTKFVKYHLIVSTKKTTS